MSGCSSSTIKMHLSCSFNGSHHLMSLLKSGNGSKGGVEERRERKGGSSGDGRGEESKSGNGSGEERVW